MPTRTTPTASKRRSAPAAPKAPAAAKRAKATVPAAGNRPNGNAQSAALGAAETPPRTSKKPASGKPHKPVLVRDSFTMPEVDFAQIAALKKRAIAFQRPAKKSELLRAGLHALSALDDAALKKALDELLVIKAGRPKKH